MSDSCDSMDCSLPGSSVHGIFQARIPERVAIPFSRGSSWPRDQTQVSCIAGGFFTDWATREAPEGEHRLAGNLSVIKLGNLEDWFSCTVILWPAVLSKLPSLHFSSLGFRCELHLWIFSEIPIPFIVCGLECGLDETFSPVYTASSYDAANCSFRALPQSEMNEVWSSSQMNKVWFLFTHQEMGCTSAPRDKSWFVPLLPGS